jgi:hypothetical protein
MLPAKQKACLTQVKQALERKQALGFSDENRCGLCGTLPASDAWLALPLNHQQVVLTNHESLNPVELQPGAHKSHRPGFVGPINRQKSP